MSRKIRGKGSDSASKWADTVALVLAVKLCGLGKCPWPRCHSSPSRILYPIQIWSVHFSGFSHLGHSAPHNMLFPFLSFETAYFSRLRANASSFMWSPLITPAGCDLSGLFRDWQTFSEKGQIINISALWATWSLSHVLNSVSKQP